MFSPDHNSEAGEGVWHQSLSKHFSVVLKGQEEEESEVKVPALWQEKEPGKSQHAMFFGIDVVNVRAEPYGI